MEPTEPTQPMDSTPAPEPEPPAAPPVAWGPPTQEPPPPASGPALGELFANRSAASLTLGDAFSTGFGLLGRVSFIVPVLILGVAVNAIAATLLQPFIDKVDLAATSPGSITPADISAVLSSILGAIALSIVGAILVNVYGQVWAVTASSGPVPTISTTIGLASRRWIGIVGVGLVVGVLTFALSIGAFIVVGLAFALVGIFGILAFLAALVLIVWVGSRLSMAGWLAAEGHSVSASINGSWAMTRGNLLRIIGWGLAYGIVFGLIGGVLGLLLGLVPYVGSGIAQSISLGLGYGAGITLYRRTQAAAAAAAPHPATGVAT